MNTTRVRLIRSLVAVGFVSALAFNYQPARADDETGSYRLSRLSASLGGYYFTGGSAMRALGNTKFAESTEFFARPRIRGSLAIAAGVQSVGAGDHPLPFSGGNRFDLIGPVLRIQQVPRLNRIAPFVTGGFLYGTVRSERENFRAFRWAPSVAAGVEYRFNRSLSLSASYRLTERFGGVDTSGAALTVRMLR